LKNRPARDKTDDARREAAQALAIAALAFLAEEPDRLGRFLTATGIEPHRLRDAARESGFLAGVLEHLSGDEELLIAFAKYAGIDPKEIERARTALGGVWERDIP
jgi:hypothetical protein